MCGKLGINFLLNLYIHLCFVIRNIYDIIFFWRIHLFYYIVLFIRKEIKKIIIIVSFLFLLFLIVVRFCLKLTNYNIKLLCGKVPNNKKHTHTHNLIYWYYNIVLRIKGVVGIPIQFWFNFSDKTKHKIFLKNKVFFFIFFFLDIYIIIIKTHSFDRFLIICTKKLKQTELL